MKKITILSGKGGVGKSSIAASLAVVLSKKHKIICADCDVDASNLALVLGLKEKDFVEWKPMSTNQKAVFDLDKCKSCKECYESCYFDAIAWQNNYPKLKEFGCEGCGLCKIICPHDAIKLVDVYNAKIGYGKTKYGFNIVSAQLEMGESGSGKIVAAVKEFAMKKQNADFMVIDAAAGIGCPVIASVTGSDYVISVTEPTPSAFADLKRALQMVNHFKIKSALIINKFDLNVDYSKKIEKFAQEKNIKVISKLPYDKSFLHALVALTPLVIYNENYLPIFQEIADTIKKEIF